MEHPIPDLAASTSDDDTDTDNCNDATTEQQSTSSISSLALVLHGLTSMAILYYFTSSLPPHPHQLETHQIQLLGTVLIAFLSIHAIVYFYLAAATAPPHRRPSPSLSSTSTPHDATPSVRLLESVEALNGTWIRDKEASDSMDAVCDLMSLNPLLRMAIGLIKGVDLKAHPTREGVFAIDVLSGVLWFKIKERYDLQCSHVVVVEGVDGECTSTSTSGGREGRERKHRRRDFRGGGSLGSAAIVSFDGNGTSTRKVKASNSSSKTRVCAGGMEVRNRFGPPLQGTMRERMYCPSANVLYVDTLMDVPERGPPLQYRQVYRRRVV